MALVNFRYVIFGVFFEILRHFAGICYFWPFLAFLASFDPLRMDWSSSVHPDFVYGPREFQVHNYFKTILRIQELNDLESFCSISGSSDKTTNLESTNPDFFFLENIFVYF